MKRFILSGIILLGCTFSSLAQIAHDMLVGVQADLMKTDHDELLRKAQFGLEWNYFIIRDLTATAGFDIWTADEFSFIIGSRWFPIEHAFVRARGYIGQNDFSLGAGWTKPLTPDFKFEAIGDFYFSLDFAVRVGVVYIIRRGE
jgi:hypothetical protein